MLSFHIFPIYRVEKYDIPGTVGISNPVSRNFKTQIPDIPSKKVANPAEHTAGEMFTNKYAHKYYLTKKLITI